MARRVCGLGAEVDLASCKPDPNHVRVFLDDFESRLNFTCAVCGEDTQNPLPPVPCGHIVCVSCGGNDGCRACNKQADDGNGVLPPQLHSAKIRAVVKALQANMAEGCRVVVFSQWTGFLDLLSKALNGQTPAIPWMSFTGKLSIEQRQRRVSWLNERGDGHGRVLLVSLMAGSVGLNLTGATKLYLMDLWWNPAIEEQAIQRIHRIGQTRDVHVYKLVMRDTIEEGILHLQKNKALISDAMLDASHSGVRGHYANLQLADFKALLARGDASTDESG